MDDKGEWSTHHLDEEWGTQDASASRVPGN
jgi:hypothetical protein